MASSFTSFGHIFELEKKAIGGKENSIYGYRKITTDKSGNKYVVHFFKTTFNLDTFHLTSTEKAVCILKYNKSNQLVFAKKIAEGNILQFSVANDKSSNIYVGYIFKDSVKNNINTFTSTLYSDFIIDKLDSNANLLHTIYDTSSLTKAIGIDALSVDDENNLYLAGGIGNDTATTSNLWTSNYNSFTIQGRRLEILLTKYDSLGNLLWVKTAGGNGIEGGGIIKTNLNDFYIIGTSQSNIITFGPSVILNVPLIYHNPGYLAKYNRNGEAIWAKYFSIINTNLGYVTCSDVKIINNNVYYAGNAINADGNNIAKVYFENGGSATGLGNWDYFLACYDTSGSFKWKKISQCVTTENIQELESDSNGNLVALGEFENTMPMGNDTLTRVGGSDIFVTSLDSNGNYLWSTSAGGAGVEVGNGIATTTDGDIYVVGGTSSNTCYFGQDAVQVDSLPSMFLAKIVNATPVGLQNFSKEDLWEVFPNPVSTMLEIRCPMVGKKEIQLYNAVGQLVINVKTEHQTSNIETSKLPEGIYFLQLKQQGQTSTKKINIIH